MNISADDIIEIADKTAPMCEAPSDVATLFFDFAKLCDTISESTRKSEKSVVIADWLSTLGPETLVIGARCLSGYIFPLREFRTLNVSNLIILNCFAACAGVPTSFVKERLAALGDIGDVAFELFSGGLPIVISESLTLTHVVAVLTQLSTMSGTKRKSEMIVRLLRKASPLEAKYLVRIMTGDLCIGVQESDVEDAISRWKDISFNRVQTANMLTGDIGETALITSRGKIDEVRMRLFTPVHYMHASQISLKDDFSKVLPEQFIVEDKFDGIRAQVHIGLDFPGGQIVAGTVHEGLRVAVFSDSLDDVTGNFLDLVPGLAALLSDQAGTVDAVGVILDGVIVPTRNGEIRPFTELRKRLSRKHVTSIPTDLSVAFIAFDLLLSEGRSQIQENWKTRSVNMDKITFDMSSTFRARSVAVSTPREVENILEMAMLRGSQGVLLKDPRSTYGPSRRGRQWLKIYGGTL